MKTVNISDLYGVVDDAGRIVDLCPDDRAMNLVRAETNPVTGGIENFSDPTGGVSNVLAKHGVKRGVMDYDIFQTRIARAPKKLVLPTPYAAISDEVVHPSVAYIPDGFQGYRYWMAYTPYPGTDSQYENPCIARSSDGKTWDTPAGAPNPIVGKPVEASGYNSDTHLMYYSGKLYLLFRSRNVGTPAKNRLYLMESADGVTWSSPVAIWEDATATSDMASPSLLWDGAQFVIYGHNVTPNPTKLRRMTSASLYSGWSAPADVTIPNPVTAGNDWWHSSIKIDSAGRFYGLAQDEQQTLTGDQGSIYLLSSGDGTNFSVKPLVMKGVNMRYYRSDVVVEDRENGPVANLFIGVKYQPAAGGATTWQIWNTHAPMDNDAYRAQQVALKQSLVSGVANGVAGALFADTFKRADAGSLGTSTCGTVWGAPDAGTFAISSNKASPTTAGNNRIRTNLGSADYFAQATIAAVPGAVQQFLIFRSVDGSNYFRLGWSGSNFALQKIVSGSIAATTLIDGPVLSGDTLAVRCKGANITALRNGVEVLQTTDTSFETTGTYIGFQANNTGPAFGELYAYGI